MSTVIGQEVLMREYSSSLIFLYEPLASDD